MTYAKKQIFALIDASQKTMFYDLRKKTFFDANFKSTNNDFV